MIAMLILRVAKRGDTGDDGGNDRDVGGDGMTDADVTTVIANSEVVVENESAIVYQQMLAIESLVKSESEHGLMHNELVRPTKVRVKIRSLHPRALHGANDDGNYAK